MSTSAKVKLGVFKFASCDGCQLSLLDAEDELLTIAARVEIAHFLELSSKITNGPFDIALVEGSIVTAHDAERIQAIREQSNYLVTIGACATSGGIQALRNWADCGEMVRAVYPSPEYIETLATSTGIAEHIHVDFELRGCPINQHQIVEVIRARLQGSQPRFPSHSVCMDCKRRGNVCITVAQGIPCLGPVTQSGCGSICPSFDRGCYGCFGPAKQPNLQSLTDQFISGGASSLELIPLLRSFNGNAPEFRSASERLSAQDTHANPSPPEVADD